MNRLKLLIIGFIILLLIEGVIVVFLTNHFTLNELTLKNATPDQLGNSMMQDDFFSNYRSDVLIVNGTVASIQKQGKSSIITFSKSVKYRVSCNIGDTLVKVGQYISVAAIAYHAQREAKGVDLGSCSTL